jgi:hypothetical protein
MNDVGIFRLYLLRAAYLVFGLGLVVVIWPHIIFPIDLAAAGPGSVVRALLGALAAMFLIGVRYPLKMLPVLLFELLWKSIWTFGIVVPMWLGPGLDKYVLANLPAILAGVILVPIVVPWGYVIKHYTPLPSERWRNRARTETSKSVA